MSQNVCKSLSKLGAECLQWCHVHNLSWILHNILYKRKIFENQVANYFRQWSPFVLSIWYKSMLIIYHTFILYYMMFHRCVWIATLAPVMIYDWAQWNKVGMSSCVCKLFDGKYIFQPGPAITHLCKAWALETALTLVTIPHSAFQRAELLLYFLSCQ